LASEPVRRIFVVDHQPLVARGLVALLSDEPDFEVLTGSLHPDRIPAEVKEFRADLIILGLPEADTELMETARRLRRQRPSIRFVVLADPTPSLDISELVRIGITAILTRNASQAEVLATVRQGLAGRSLLGSEVAGRLMNELAIAVRRADNKGVGGGLTRRELDVLTLVADGLPNKEVAGRLHISENTVKNHMRSVHDKLGVRTRTEAVVTAAREGLLGLK